MQKSQDTAPATTARTLDRGRRNLLRGGLAGLAGAPFLASSLAGSTAAKPIGPGLLEPGPVSAGPAANQPVDMEQLFRQIKREATPEQLYRFLYAMPKGGRHSPSPRWRISAAYVAGDRNGSPAQRGGSASTLAFRVTNPSSASALEQAGREPRLPLAHPQRPRTTKSLRCRLYQRDLKPLDELNPSEAEHKAWMSSVVLDEPGEGRNEFFEYHWTRLGDLMSSIHVVSELLVENMKLFGAEGTRYLEIQRGYRWLP